MAHSILLANEFDKDNVVFAPPKVNRLGGQSVYVNYGSGEVPQQIILQTTRVRVPFGIDQTNGDNGPVKYHFSISLATDEEEGTLLRQFTDNIRAIDTLAKNNPQQSDSWFGKKLSTELVNEFYKSAEKFPKDKKWASTLKIKLPFDQRGNPQFSVYDQNKKAIDIVDADGNVNTDCIPKGSEAVCLIQPIGVWFVGKTQFGVNYKLLQAKVYKSNKLSGYSIVDSEPEDEEEEENVE